MPEVGEVAVREQIFVWIEDALRAQERGEVERMPSNDPIVYPARHIFDGGHRVIENGVGEARLALTVRVEGYVESADGPAAHAALHALFVDTVRALVTEPPIGGLAETVDEGDFMPLIAPLGGKSRLCFTLEIPITFAASRGDPAQLP